MQTDPLSRFIKLVEQDPLFAAEGMDLDNAGRVISAMETALDSVEDIYKKRSLKARLFCYAYPLKSYAIPVPFIRAFTEAERARREFLERKDMPSARSLAAAWKEAAKEYKRSIERQRTYFEFLVAWEHAGEKTVQDTAGNRYTMDEMRDTFRTIEENGEKLVAEAGERARACVLTSGSTVQHNAHHGSSV
jgi:predicted Zn-dependent peptidase